ncbi:hypothetical protein GcC1_044017 [Golovinomyces cichoracearum]|uniref:Uncharacterized protein n=1 Tax=Golovinomyces cichoracearum TaxID=62708 RepID=A0A420IYJ1_9PEZI|nr:hypothetical protein GcC1_044017 [Golovinomyces cichoracearum]
MTIKYRPSSLIYFLLFFSGSQSFVVNQQKIPRRHRRRLNCLRTLTQRFPVPYTPAHKNFSHYLGFKQFSSFGTASFPPNKAQKSMEIYQRRIPSNDSIIVNSKSDSGDFHQAYISICDSCNSRTKTPKSISPLQSVTDRSFPSLQSHRPSRLSLSLPIATNKSSIDSITATPSQTTTPKSDLAAQALLSPSNSNSFLVALAGQERHVFELKEELSRAETELERLQNLWEHYEDQKRKGELRSLETTRILQGHGFEENGIENLEIKDRPCFEADKRKTLLENTKNPKETRRVFSGSHTRALSLLSPERPNFTPPSQVESLQNKKKKETELQTNSVFLGISRGITSRRVKSLYSPKIMTTGAKQFADFAEEVKQGFKEGVMTLFEDLRQVTIGDEGLNGANAYRSSSADILTTNSPTVNKAGVMNTNISNSIASDSSTSPQAWENIFNNSLHDLAAPETKKNENRPSSIKPKKSKSIPLAISSIDELDDSWSNWESLNANPPRWSGSTTVSDNPSPPDSGFFDQEIKTINRSSVDPTRTQKLEDSSWLGLKTFSSEKLKGDIQKTWSTVLKELEPITLPQLDDSCEQLSQPNLNLPTTILPNSSGQSSNQEELLFMSR